jgi:hypothetical protein
MTMSRTKAALAQLPDLEPSPAAGDDSRSGTDLLSRLDPSPAADLGPEPVEPPESGQDAMVPESTMELTIDEFIAHQLTPDEEIARAAEAAAGSAPAETFYCEPVTVSAGPSGDPGPDSLEGAPDETPDEPSEEIARQAAPAPQAPESTEDLSGAPASGTEPLEVPENGPEGPNWPNLESGDPDGSEAAFPMAATAAAGGFGDVPGLDEAAPAGDEPFPASGEDLPEAPEADPEPGPREELVVNGYHLDPSAPDELDEETPAVFDSPPPETAAGEHDQLAGLDDPDYDPVNDPARRQTDSQTVVLTDMVLRDQAQETSEDEDPLGLGGQEAQDDLGESEEIDFSAPLEPALEPHIASQIPPALPPLILYTPPRPVPKVVSPEASTAVIVNYLEDTDDNMISAQGKVDELGEDEDMDIDLMDMHSQEPVRLEARPMTPVPKTPL